MLIVGIRNFVLIMVLEIQRRFQGYGEVVQVTMPSAENNFIGRQFVLF
jgi:hypothetical protein